MDRLSDITRERFEASVPGLRGESSPKHWSNILGILRKFFRWAVKRDLLLRDPTVGVPLPPSSQFGRRGPESVWTEEELEKVLARLGEADREMVLVLRHTGMDVADLFELRRQHLVKDQDGNLKIVKRREKGHTDRETMNQPVSSKVLDILMRHHQATAQPDDRIFPTKYKNFTSAGSALYDRVRRAWDSLGVKSKDLKSLRHTFATYHVKRNVPITQLRKWMGHAPDSRILESIYDHMASSAEYMD